MNKKIIFSSLTTYGIMLSLATATAIANPNHETSTQKQQTAKLPTIEQTLSTKTAVTAGGLALIGLELWWFLISKPKSKQS
ncbi:hypothetical protein A0J48_004990 [Sphaerospermopsis aphanizomenoides BCCUSP55]|nr:hypothetical protein [Sphaerospermopsis aphanizomenoides BCCUSP55]